MKYSAERGDVDVGRTAQILHRHIGREDATGERVVGERERQIDVLAAQCDTLRDHLADSRVRCGSRSIDGGRRALYRHRARRAGQSADAIEDGAGNDARRQSRRTLRRRRKGIATIAARGGDADQPDEY